MNKASKRLYCGGVLFGMVLIECPEIDSLDDIGPEDLLRMAEQCERNPFIRGVYQFIERAHIDAYPDRHDDRGPVVEPHSLASAQQSLLELRKCWAQNGSPYERSKTD